MFKSRLLPIRLLEALLDPVHVVRMNALEECIEQWLSIARVETQGAKAFHRPVSGLARFGIPSATARPAQPLRFREISLAFAQ
jgi:hypothetical protein